MKSFFINVLISFVTFRHAKGGSAALLPTDSLCLGQEHLVNFGSFDHLGSVVVGYYHHHHLTTMLGFLANQPDISNLSKVLQKHGK